MKKSVGGCQTGEMKIEKILNNNVVLTLNENSQETVVMGRGIAFQKKVGQDIDTGKIEKTFIPEGQEVMDNLLNLYRDIDPDILEIATNVIKYAQGVLRIKLSNHIYLTLPDHLSYAISRTKEGLDIKNPLTWEIKRFYKVEYEIGKKATELVEKELAVKLPDSEAASIALHIVNARQDDSNLGVTIRMTELVQDILNIVHFFYGQTFDEESFQYTRFITHLQYFARRLLNQERRESDDDFLYEQIQKKYQKAFKCTERINDYLKKVEQTSLTKDEQLYLAIHIQRVTTED
ncbi:BglG family transcription antiterminator LicT [Alkalibacterium sp.]